MCRSTSWIAAIAAVAVLLAVGPGNAQTARYPAKTVRIISPFEAGGGADLMARTLAQKFAESWDKSVIVEGRTGGSGTVGTDYVAREPADGHTLLLTTNATIVINPPLLKNIVKYDPVRDFAPISLVAAQPFVLVVNPSLPAKSFAELIALAKAKPGMLNFGSSGGGGGAHLSGEMLKTFLKIDMTHVPFKGAAPALTAVVAGHVDFMFVAIATARPFIDSGQLRPLAVTSKTRNPSLPDVPAVAEYPGLEQFEADLWYGLLAPAQTSPDVVEKIHRETLRALADEATRKRFVPNGTVLVGNTPEEFAKIIKDDIARWSEVIEASGVGKQL
jgi:tripartite-type tricarboxylate transporter receptor subunit TctC